MSNNHKSIVPKSKHHYKFFLSIFLNSCIFNNKTSVGTTRTVHSLFISFEFFFCHKSTHHLKFLTNMIMLQGLNYWCLTSLSTLLCYFKSSFTSLGSWSAWREAQPDSLGIRTHNLNDDSILIM